MDVYLASAGCGKTGRLMTIVEDYIKQGYELDDIAFVTFTRKGADVAKQRICESQGISPSKAKYFSTIHSMCFRALKCSKDIMMDKEKYRDFALKAGYNFGRFEGLNSTEGIDWKDMRDSHLINMEQLYRNNRNYWDKVVGQYVDNGRFVQYVKLYNQYKSTMHFYDFTDLLEMYIGRGLESSVKVVCIDEAQDCSLLQWQVLFKAFKNAEHICVAGDVKQSIYCFAGAEPNVLLGLRGEQHLLNKSYRVPIKLLDFAQKIANELSVSDHMICTSTKEGGKLDLLVSIDEFRYRKDKSIMMLCRNRKQFAYYIDWCKKQAVPYTINSSPVFTDSDKIAFRDSVLMNKPSPYEEWPEDKKTYALDCYKAGTFFSDPNIIISTIHGVKGDEADIVVLQSDISKLVAKGMDVDEDAEHRVFYVAVTRAKEELYIIAPQTKLYYPYILF